jgi:hypothetical protein
VTAHSPHSKVLQGSSTLGDSIFPILSTCRCRPHPIFSHSAAASPAPGDSHSHACFHPSPCFGLKPTSSPHSSTCRNIVESLPATVRLSPRSSLHRAACFPAPTSTYRICAPPLPPCCSTRSPLLPHTTVTLLQAPHRPARWQPSRHRSSLGALAPCATAWAGRTGFAARPGR